RRARGIRRPPNYRAPQFLFIGLIAPAKKSGRRGGGGMIGDYKHVFVRRRRVDEGVVPGIMARDKIAGDGGKLANLQVYPRIVEGRAAQKILIETRVAHAGTRIEAAVYPAFHQAVEMVAEPRVEEQREAGIHK